MSKTLVQRLREVTAFLRFETGDRVAAASSLSEEAADRIEALEAEVSQRHERMSEWRDISTAPKDGRRFWVPSDDGALEVQWHEGFGGFVSSWHRMEFAKGYSWTPKDGSDDVMGKYSDGTVWHDHSPNRVEPKFWMPRPQDPPQ